MPFFNVENQNATNHPYNLSMFYNKDLHPFTGKCNLYLYNGMELRDLFTSTHKL